MKYGGQEFEEIANCGGTVTFTIRTGVDGGRSYQVGFSSSRPVPMVLIGIYALPQGIPVDTIQMGGIGKPWNPPPVPNCIPVMIGSDISATAARSAGATGAVVRGHLYALTAVLGRRHTNSCPRLKSVT